MVEHKTGATDGLRNQDLLLLGGVDTEFVCFVDEHCFSPPSIAYDTRTNVLYQAGRCATSKEYLRKKI
jgi:hypothetical protein